MCLCVCKLDLQLRRTDKCEEEFDLQSDRPAQKGSKGGEDETSAESVSWPLLSTKEGEREREKIGRGAGKEQDVAT